MAAPRAFLGFAWGPHNELALAVACAEPTSTRPTGADALDTTEADLGLVEAPFAEFRGISGESMQLVDEWSAEDEARIKFASTAHKPFLELEAAKRDARGDAHTEIMKASKELRGAFFEAYFSDADSGDSTAVPGASEVESVWQLMEASALGSDAGFVLAVRDWLVTQHVEDPPVEEAIGLRGQLKGAGEAAALRERFWVVFESLLVLGEPQEAGVLAQAFGQADQDEVVQRWGDILAEYPVLNTIEDSPETLFRSAWDAWTQKVVSFARDSFVLSKLGHDSRATALLRLISGHKETLELLLRQDLSRYHALNIALTYYACPLDLNRSSLVRFMGDLLDTDYDQTRVQMQVVRGELEAALVFVLERGFTDAAMHMSNLLQAASPKRASGFKFPTWDASFRDHLLLEYSSILSTYDGMWAVAASYAAAADHASGAELAALVLERVPITSDRVADKVISMAQKLSLTPVARDVQVVRGMQWVAEEQYGSGLLWFAAARDEDRIRSVAGLLLSETGKGPESLMAVDRALMAVEGHGEIMEMPRLRFLACYRDLLRCLQDMARLGAGSAFESSKRRASQAVHELVCGSVAPRRFWARLLRLASQAGLLSEECSFTSEEASDLVLALEELAGSHRSNDYLGMVSKEELLGIRLKLGMALAVAGLDDGPDMTRVSGLE